MDELVDVRNDGSLLLNMDYFNFATGLTMCCEEKWGKLFGVPVRRRESELTQPYMNLALAIQQVTEDILFRLAATAKKLTACDYLVMAGGVALNCSATGKLLRTGMFKDIWIQPAAGDAGGAVGAAYAAWYVWLKNDRKVISGQDSMKGAYLGPEFTSSDVIRVDRKYGAPYKEYPDFNQLCNDVAELLAQGYAIGWFQGRMEYGPRALGNRSILGDPRNPEMQKKLNLKIKYREGFRPFAPSVIEEDLEEYFELNRPSPYMLIVAPVQEKRRNALPDKEEQMGMWDRLYHLRSDIPAITHVDYSARIQSVNRRVNEKYWKLIKAFKDKTGYGLIVNTSFNVRGEPIVCTPEDAYRCFMRTEMDFLVIGNYLFDKSLQNKLPQDTSWEDMYELD